ncbi:Ribose operon repressor [Burkholderia cepacia GG4]|uniref:Ribose operon repressor n=1 Tax=Burkholderia cepacia GG4 TaxID=1009846 RepID=A0A9W3PCV5_BURCE|nr:Ribose operon repressor [Burkholderia cepacia GG4]
MKNVSRRSVTPCVAVDFREAGRIAARYLLERGHEAIGVIVDGSASGVQAGRATTASST